MAPAKKPLKASTPPASKAKSRGSTRPNPFSGKGGHKNRAANAAAFKKAQAAVIAEIAAPPVLRTADGKHALVVQGAVPRPTKYTFELGKRVCMAFATDTRMTLGRLNADPTMPTIMTLYDWLTDHPDFEKLYTRARQIQQDTQAEELADDAEAIRRGEIRVTKSGTDAQGNSFDSEEVRVIDNVDRSRLYVETRKWLLSKQRPKKYGIQPVEVDNTNGGLTDLLAQFRARSKELENEPS